MEELSIGQGCQGCRGNLLLITLGETNGNSIDTCDTPDSRFSIGNGGVKCGLT